MGVDVKVVRGVFHTFDQVYKVLELKPIHDIVVSDLCRFFYIYNVFALL